MPDADDIELLRDYGRHGSETAFAELVRRHIALVYSVALRNVGITAHVEEITQAVFIILSRKTGGLRPDTILEGWLYETTRLVSLSFLRGERRRQFREQEAYMQSTLQESAGDLLWNQLAPLLDEAMSRLGKKDRDAVILRFFKEQSVREVAATLQINEAAMQRRILRALKKLRKFFTKRGVSSTTAIIAGAISAHSVHAAPAALVKSVTVVALAKGAAASSPTLTLIKGALKVMAWTKAKTAIIVGAGVLLAAGTTTITVNEIEAHGTLNIRMHIDGSDIIKVSVTQLWIEHRSYLLPDNPIYVNGKLWSPRWNGNVSTRFTGLSRAFNPHNLRKIELAVVAGRGTARIEQLPAPDNNQTLSVMIDDKDYDGADWYQVVISW